jgi:hypothetical protein
MTLWINSDHIMNPVITVSLPIAAIAGGQSPFDGADLRNLLDLSP